jgi:hypothetical protein
MESLILAFYLMQAEMVGKAKAQLHLFLIIDVRPDR